MEVQRGFEIQPMTSGEFRLALGLQAPSKDRGPLVSAANRARVDTLASGASERRQSALVLGLHGHMRRRLLRGRRRKAQGGHEGEVRRPILGVDVRVAAQVQITGVSLPGRKEEADL